MNARPSRPSPAPRPTGLARLSLWTASFVAGCAVVAATGGTGCSSGGGGAAPSGAAKVSGEPAKATVVAFLEAIKRGDDDAASGLLTTVARTKTQELGLSVAPPVNPSARYEVKDCEAVGEAGDLVHVGTVWTDVSEDGQESSENIVWVVRLDPEGWRVVGMAMKVFDDLPPLLLNFEDPDDMISKQEMVAEELQRRAKAQSGAAAQPEAASGPAATTAAQPAAERRR